MTVLPSNRQKQSVIDIYMRRGTFWRLFAAQRQGEMPIPQAEQTIESKAVKSVIEKFYEKHGQRT
jgi:hypothetical protein